MLRASLLEPAPEPLREFIDEQLRTGDTLVQVAGEFEVFYQGRAASVAEAGDYLLMIKADGSVQVHSRRGVKPVNWQPQTDDLRVTIEDGYAVLTAERFTPAELLRVGFLSPAVAQAFDLRDGGSFVLIGSEAEMQASLASSPEVIEPGLVLVDMELPTDVGGIDLLARDVMGRLVVVELKRGKATHEAVHQLSRYVDSVRALVAKTRAAAEVRGVLAAPSVTGPALNRLGVLGLEFKEITALPDSRAASTEQPGLF